MTPLAAAQAERAAVPEGGPPVRKRWRTAAALVAAPVILVVAMWIPFGFAMNGLYEEWWIFGTFAHSGPAFFVTVDGAFAAQAGRPLLLPFALSYALDPTSFLGMNVVLIAVLLVQGIAFGYLARKLTGSTLWGAVGGVLLLLQPADSAVYAFRALPTSFALALALVASCVFVIAWDLARPRLSLLTGIDGTNTVEFTSDVDDDYFGLSAKLDSFTLRPAASR